MIKVLFSIFLVFSMAGCVTNPPHQSLYNKQLVEIESAYQNHKITYAEYLNLKDNIEDARQQRKATVLAAYIGKTY